MQAENWGGTLTKRNCAGPQNFCDVRPVLLSLVSSALLSRLAMPGDKAFLATPVYGTNCPVLSIWTVPMICGVIVGAPNAISTPGSPGRKHVHDTS